MLIFQRASWPNNVDELVCLFIADTLVAKSADNAPKVITCDRGYLDKMFSYYRQEFRSSFLSFSLLDAIVMLQYTLGGTAFLPFMFFQCNVVADCFCD